MQGTERTHWEYNGIPSLGSPHLVAKLQSAHGVEILDAKAGDNGRLTSNSNGHINEVNYSDYGLRTRRFPGSPTSSPSSSPQRKSPAKTVSCSAPVKSEKDYVIRNYFFYYLFLCGAELGNELFYSILWPCLIWHVDCHVARHVALMWAITITVGQALKEIIASPRPSSPPAVHMEERYELEYGMPSTHSVVGVSVPVALLLHTWAKYELAPIAFPLIVVIVVWCMLTSLSRVYLGMHSVLDVLAGLLLGMIMILPCLYIIPKLDHLFLDHNYGYLFIVMVALSTCWFYPTLRQWNTSRADTFMVMAVCMGLYIGSKLNLDLGLVVNQMQTYPQPLGSVNVANISEIVISTVVGIALLAITRQVTKTAITSLLCTIHPEFDVSDPVTLRDQRFEFVYKMVVYVSISMVVTVVCPLIFNLMGTQRAVYINEYY